MHALHFPTFLCNYQHSASTIESQFTCYLLDLGTPPRKQLCSKRSWDGQIKLWRRLLHYWDDKFPPSSTLYTLPALSNSESSQSRKPSSLASCTHDNDVSPAPGSNYRSQESSSSSSMTHSNRDVGGGCVKSSSVSVSVACTKVESEQEEDVMAQALALAQALGDDDDDDDGISDIDGDSDQD